MPRKKKTTDDVVETEVIAEDTNEEAVEEEAPAKKTTRKRKKKADPDLSELYGEDYFIKAYKSQNGYAYQHTPVWQKFFGAVAQRHRTRRWMRCRCL